MPSSTIEAGSGVLAQISAVHAQSKQEVPTTPVIAEPERDVRDAVREPRELQQVAGVVVSSAEQCGRPASGERRASLEPMALCEAESVVRGGRGEPAGTYDGCVAIAGSPAFKPSDSGSKHLRRQIRPRAARRIDDVERDDIVAIPLQAVERYRIRSSRLSWKSCLSRSSTGLSVNVVSSAVNPLLAVFTPTEIGSARAAGAISAIAHPNASVTPSALIAPPIQCPAAVYAGCLSLRYRPRLRQVGQHGQLRARTDGRRSPHRAASHLRPTSRRARPLALRGRWPSWWLTPARQERPRTRPARAERDATRTIVAFISRSGSADVRTFAHSTAVSRVQPSQLQGADQPGYPGHFCFALDRGCVTLPMFPSLTTNPMRGRRYSLVIADRQTGAVRRFTVALWPVLGASSRCYSLPISSASRALERAIRDRSSCRRRTPRCRSRTPAIAKPPDSCADQVAALQTAVNELGDHAVVDPTASRAMERLPALVKSRADGRLRISVTSSDVLERARTARHGLRGVERPARRHQQPRECGTPRSRSGRRRRADEVLTVSPADSPRQDALVVDPMGRRWMNRKVLRIDALRHPALHAASMAVDAVPHDRPV